MTIRRIEFDYIAPPRRPRWMGYTLLAVSLAIAGHLTLKYREAQLELTRAAATKGLLNTERREPRGPSKERLNDQVKNVEAVMRQLSLPWAMLIQTLEDAATGDVSILQLQPDAQQQFLRITAEARNMGAMFEYLRGLAAMKVLFNVHLANYQPQLDDPQRPIQFSVQASFKATR